MTDDQETQAPESAPSAATSPPWRRRRGRTQSCEATGPSGSASCTSEEGLSSSSSSSTASEADEEEDESRFVDLNYLFTNDKLKKEPPMAVLRSDPFCIPRVTDNVPEYRPRFNPLSILEHEESLLPGYFRLDPHEGVPGVPKHAWQHHQPQPHHDQENSLNQQPLLHQQQRRPPLAAKRGRECEIVVPDDVVVSSSYEDALTSAASSPTASSPQIASLSIHTPTAAGSSSSSSLFGDYMATPEPPTTPFGGKRSAAMLMGTLPRRHSEAFADIPVPDLILHMPHATSSATFPTTSPAFSSTFAGKGYRNWDELTTATTGGDSISPSVLSDASFLASLQHTAGAAVDGHNSHPVSPSSINLGDKLMSYLPSRDGLQDEDHANDGGFLSVHDGLHYDDFQRSKAMATAQFYPPPQSTSSSGGSTPQPKKPRSKNIFRPCTAAGCTKGARGKSGLCQKHGGGKRCAAPNCSKGAQGSSNMCLFHGGGYRCTVKGCQTGARGTSGLCAKHGGYKRTKSIEGRMSDLSDDYARMDPMSPMDRAPLLL